MGYQPDDSGDNDGDGDDGDGVDHKSCSKWGMLV